MSSLEHISVQHFVQAIEELAVPEEPTLPELTVKEEDFIDKADYYRALAAGHERYDEEMEEYQKAQSAWESSLTQIREQFKEYCFEEAGDLKISDYTRNRIWEAIEHQFSDLDELNTVFLVLADLADRAYEEGQKNALEADSSLSGPKF